MGKRLEEIAEELRQSPKTVQLIYAFNGTGKTRLSKAFKNIVQGDDSPTRDKIIYYSAFTEDLFYWDNDLENNKDYKLKVQPNSFLTWIIEEQGQDQNIIKNFQHHTDDKLNPSFDLVNNQVIFIFQRGNEEIREQVKLSKGEESNFIWSIFYTLLELVISERKIAEAEERSTRDFDNLEYIFIDDPVSSLDENHLIEVASNLAGLIKESNDERLGLKFIITTHNPLFYNVLHNEFGNAGKYRLEKLEDGTYQLHTQRKDSPFAYHLFLCEQISKAIAEDSIQKFHFNFLRNLYEKTSTFLGYKDWKELFPEEATDDVRQAYKKRILDFSSHSKHSAEETTELNSTHKQMLVYLFHDFIDRYHFYKEE
ncbi:MULTISPECIES: AAA family ATPase [Streptococcus]|uniref:AAA family ATPase n=1 Tax=Streptococcus TaxID=1301 RepID=UPI00042170B1|nr:AAA family ATPase [Streptococcus suis]MBM0195574.1 AAA family ATPase [Streptococcus suis]MBM7312700.1 AAA family ATPase [Streptococcus suis]MBM7317505.1 AAA family ATPase [Streptococcus suis]MBM7318518.1 AAA family ATPase [Streptococcus suis]MBO3757001.1 AAA family ATPase [Streptococcus suis]